MVTVVALAFCASPPAAIADGSTVPGQPLADDTIVVGLQSGRPPSGAGGKDSHHCEWTPAGESGTFDTPTIDHRVINGDTQLLYFRACPKAVDLIWVSQVSPKKLGAVVVAQAKAKLPKPTLGAAPPSNTGIVNVDMWLWTDPTEYAPVSTPFIWIATPTGPLWAQATATPLRLVFTPGEPDSQPVACDGPGQAWLPGFGDDAVSSCTYRYLHSSQISPTGTFGAQWSIVWSITWRSNASTESLPAYLTTTTAEVTVKEVQAVIIG